MAELHGGSKVAIEQLKAQFKENRYARLMNKVIRSGVKTKVLMLSATSVNKRSNDLRNQLQPAYERQHDLLQSAIQSIITVKEESDIDNFLNGVQGKLFTNEIRVLDDFELICFLVIK